MKNIDISHGQKFKLGFGLIETIVAVGIFAIVASTGVIVVLQSFSAHRLSEEETQATLIAQEGIEAIRSIRNQGWSDPFLTTDCSSGCGVETSTGSWSFVGSSNTLGKFIRVVTVTSAQRDGNGNLVESGGTVDPDAYFITSEVDWNFTPTRQNQVSVSTYLTNFVKAISNLDWSNPVLAAAYDLGGNDNGWKVAYQNNYLYVARTGGNPDFAIFDVSTPSSPNLIGSVDTSGRPYNLVVEGSYVYFASSSNTQELQIYDISNPASPTLIGSYDLGGNTNAFSIDKVGNYAYLTRDSSNNDELIVFDVSNPSSPSLISSLNFGSDANDIEVIGNYAYVVVDNDPEVQVIDVSNPSSISVVGSIDLPTGNNGETIVGEGNLLLVGRANGYFETLDISALTSPTQLSSQDLGGNIRDIALGPNAEIAFIAGDTNAGEIIIVDISSPSAPTEISRLNIDPNSDVNGIIFSLDQEVLFGVAEDDGSELIVIEPQ
jgi:Tfp pilus assembly protein PilV